MRILHTESSNGWGGQEIRILKEAEGMRDRGHEVVMAVTTGGKLIREARKKGFIVYEVVFKKKSALKTLMNLLRIIRKHDIDIVNTHSSLDAWIGGIAGRLAKKKIIRTRHLSTAIRPGLNSRLLYRGLTDYVVTTSSAIIPMICSQSGQKAARCQCIPTGVDPSLLQVDPQEVAAFRKKLSLKEDDILVGTACFVRSWKGIRDLMKAAQLLKADQRIKWVIVGGGYVEDYKGYAKELGLDDVLYYTGHLESPYAAIKAMDIFTLLSTAHEGVSQASLQAAFLERPLITTPVGGLPEVCIEGKTGLIVPTFSPEKVVEAVLKLGNDKTLRQTMGKNAKQLVEEKFTISLTIERMEEVGKCAISSSELSSK